MLFCLADTKKPQIFPRKIAQILNIPRTRKIQNFRHEKMRSNSSQRCRGLLDEHRCGHRPRHWMASPRSPSLNAVNTRQEIIITPPVCRTRLRSAATACRRAKFLRKHLPPLSVTHRRLKWDAPCPPRSIPTRLRRSPVFWAGDSRMGRQGRSVPTGTRPRAVRPCTAARQNGVAHRHRLPPTARRHVFRTRRPTHWPRPSQERSRSRGAVVGSSSSTAAASSTCVQHLDAITELSDQAADLRLRAEVRSQPACTGGRARPARGSSDRSCAATR
jgi:hypothetical protein